MNVLKLKLDHLDKLNMIYIGLENLRTIMMQLKKLFKSFLNDSNQNLHDKKLNFT